MTMLAKPKYHPMIVELAIQMGEDVSNMYPVTQQWVTTPVTGRTTEEDEMIERAMDANIADFWERIYVDITGVPPQKDLFTTTPKISHMHGEDGVVNVRPIVKILLDGRLHVGNEALTSSIDAVVQAERSQWR